MKNWINFFILFILIFFFSNASAIGTLSREVLTFWFTQLVPSMFLSIFLIQLLSETSFFTFLSQPFQFLCPILKMNEEGLGFVFSCLLIGCPSSVILINQAYQNERITQSMANRLLLCTPVATVSFLVMSVGAQMLQNQTSGIVLWILQIAVSFVLLWLTRSIPLTMNPQIIKKDDSKKKHPISGALFQTGSTLFLIGGYLLMFQTVSFLIEPILPVSWHPFFKIISEFSYGCHLIANSMPFEKAFVYISCLCGFNGLCVQFQALSLSELKIPVHNYFLFRLLQALLCFICGQAVLPLLVG